MSTYHYDIKLNLIIKKTEHSEGLIIQATNKQNATILPMPIKMVSSHIYQGFRVQNCY